MGSYAPRPQGSQACAVANNAKNACRHAFCDAAAPSLPCGISLQRWSTFAIQELLQYRKGNHLFSISLAQLYCPGVVKGFFELPSPKTRRTPYLNPQPLLVENIWCLEFILWTKSEVKVAPHAGRKHSLSIIRKPQLNTVVIYERKLPLTKQLFSLKLQT